MAKSINIVDALTSATLEVTKDWARQRKAEERSYSARFRRRDALVRVQRWTISDHKRTASELPGVTVWATGCQKPFTISDGHLDDKSRREIRHLFRALAYGKEAA